MEHFNIITFLVLLCLGVSLNKADISSSHAALLSSEGTSGVVASTHTSPFSINGTISASTDTVTVVSTELFATSTRSEYVTNSTSDTRRLSISGNTTWMITTDATLSSVEMVYPSTIIRSSQNSIFHNVNSTHTLESDTKLWSSSNSVLPYETSTTSTLFYPVFALNPVNQSGNTTIVNRHSSSMSTVVSSIGNTSSSNQSTLSIVQVPTIQTTPYLISPSLPQYNTPARLPLRSYNMSCGQVLQAFPIKLNISEHDSDKVLITIMHGTTTNITAEVVYPENIATTLDIHFKIRQINYYTKNILLTQAVDIEQIYVDTKTVVNYIGLKLTCRDSNTITSKTINITVEDIDDNGPTFEHSDMSRCALPLYTAGAGEHFVGTLHLSPGAIRAVDGDLINTNTVSYRFLHGDPINYHSYFTIDYVTGSVNKTSNITETDPHDFVIVVQATEESAIKRSKVAVLTVSVSFPTPTPTTGPYRANRTVITVLQILSVVVILSFSIGFVYIVRHRNKKQKVQDVNELEENPKLITDIDDLIVSSSCEEVKARAQPDIILQAPEPTMLSVPSPDPVPSTSQSPVSTRKVSFVLPEKTYRMIYGTRGRRNKKV